MNESNFLKLAKEMRDTQKEYFATRSKGALIRSKDLEKKFDGELKQLIIQSESTGNAFTEPTKL